MTASFKLMKMLQLDNNGRISAAEMVMRLNKD